MPARVAAAAAVVTAAGGAQGLWAQQVTLPSNVVAAPEVAADLVTKEPRAGLLRAGPFDISFRADGSVYYDDNVYARALNVEEDVVFTVSPGISAVATDMADGVGKSLTMEYAPAFLFYLDQTDLNDINHFARMDGVWNMAKLSLGFGQTFSYATDPVVDLGQRSERIAYDLRLTSRYPFGEKLSVNVDGTFHLEDYSDFNSYWDLANSNWINYDYSPKLNLGLGLVFGYNDIQDYTDQAYQQGRLRVIYALAEKLNLNASGGAEWRQYRSEIDDQITPVWDLALSYRPTEKTAVAVNLYQRYSSSAFYGSENYLSTGVGASVRQAIVGRLGVTLDGSFYHADYEATQGGVSSNREDDVVLIRVGLDTTLAERWTLGVFYDFQNNSSSDVNFDFDRNRVGVQASWRY
jgi:hypothetical protein